MLAPDVYANVSFASASNGRPITQVTVPARGSVLFKVRLCLGATAHGSLLKKTKGGRPRAAE